MNRLNSAAVLAVALVLTACLAGCTVSYTPPGSAATAPAGAETIPDAAPPASGSGATEPRPEVTTVGDLRAEYGATASTVSCPDGELTVSQAAAVVTVAEDCALITIVAGGTVVLAAHVDSLVVEGAASLVQVASADRISISGSGSTVLWDSGSPQVTDTGASNTARPSQEEERR